MSNSNNNNVETTTPPSPRRSWIKIGVMGRARSVENMHPEGSQQYHNSYPSPRPKSPPLTLTSGSPGVEGKKIPMSPLDTPPTKLWENKFKSFLSKRSQQQQQHTSANNMNAFPEVPLMAPMHRQKQQQQQSQTLERQKAQQSSSSSSQNNDKGSSSSCGTTNAADQSVRGGKIFQSIFGGVTGHSQRKQRRKTRSLNELDEPMRNGKDKNCSPDSTRYRRVQSQANVVVVNGGSGSGSEAALLAPAPPPAAADDLSQSLRRASYAGTRAGAIVPPPMHSAQHLHQAGFLQQQQKHLHQAGFLQQQQQQQSQHNISPALHHMQQSHTPQPSHYNPLGHRPTAEYYPYPSNTTNTSITSTSHVVDFHNDLRSSELQVPYPPQQPQFPPPTHHPHQHPPPPVGLPISNDNNNFHSPIPSAGGGSSAHSMSPSSATTEIKKAFTEFHNSSRYARDSTSAYLGDDPSTRHGEMFKTGLVAQQRIPLGSHFRQFSIGCIDNNSGHRYWGNPRSLPTVDENVSIHKSMRMLRPFQMVDSWQAGRRYLIGPAALATCPLLQGVPSLTRTTRDETENICSRGPNDEDRAENLDEQQQDSSVNLSLTQLPPLFGCIVLGNALLSYVAQEPLHHHQQRWWSSSLLILRQNYLLEYDQQSANTVSGLPRGYAHLQYSNSYAHSDFVDALELEFFVSPCAKADKRVLTIRLQEAREKRDNWITCLNRAARIGIRDMYDYDDSAEVGRGRYATVYPARRRTQATAHFDLGEKATSSSAGSQQTLAPTDEYNCALKIIDKKEFWRRVVKGRERADTLVRETSVQATMTCKCSKIPAFVRLRGFFETSDNIVLELELLQGIDLFQYVSSKGVLSEKEAACILRDILTVLDGLNRLGVAHRDIKPANCLMCKAGDDNSFDKVPTLVKVADFGMATFVGVDGLVRGRCGTPGYVAPEIFSAGLHGGYGNKVDIFSAGVTLYVMLCGYEPFYGESDEELVAANREAKLDFPTNDWKNVSSEAKNLVKRMMEPDPRRRLCAKEALKHPWIVGHVGETDSVQVVGHSGVDSLSHSIHNKGESCTIS